MVDDIRRVVGGRYWLSSGLGQGSTSGVYRALDLELGLPVAVKLLKPEFADDAEARSSMALEAHLVSRVQHPGVVRVLDVGETQTFDTGPVLPYLVLELVPGRTVQSLIARGEALEPAYALSIVKDLLEALDSCHAAGVLHRDVKPANVVLTDTGGVKLVDFGIARLLSGPPATVAPAVRGTVKYMAPERLCGADADARSDLYSVGALLYQLLLGRPPFIGDVPTVIQQQLYEEPARPSQLDPALGEAFDQPLLTALAKDPAERYASAMAMRTALAGLVVEKSAVSLPHHAPAALALVPAAVGSRAAVGRWAPSAVVRPPRRQAVIAAALAAALLPAVGFLVRSNDLNAGSLQAGASAAELPGRERVLSGPDDSAASPPGAEDAVGTLRRAVPGIDRPAEDSGSAVKGMLLTRANQSLNPGRANPTTSEAGSGSLEGVRSSWSEDKVGSGGSGRPSDAVLPEPLGEGPDPRPTGPSPAQEPTPRQGSSRPAAGQPESPPPGRQTPVVVPAVPPTTQPPPRAPKPKSPAKPGKPDAPPPKSPRPDAPRPDRPAKPDAPRPDKPAKPDAPRPDRPGKPASDRPSKPGRPDSPGQPDRSAEPERPGKAERPDNPGRSGRPDKPEKPVGDDKSAKPDKDEKKSGKLDKGDEDSG